MSDNLLNLQNGSDIRGVALEDISEENVNLTPKVASLIGEAFLIWLSKRKNKRIDMLKICIGRDPRLSGENLLKALISGAVKKGANIFDAELASTPAMFMSCIDKEFSFDGAIMITASHLPWNRNGFKFFTSDGGLDKKDIRDILMLAESIEVTAPIDFSKSFKVNELIEPADLIESYESIENPETYANYKIINLMQAYSAHLKNIILSGLSKYNIKSLENMHIVVDAGNGSGGFFANDVLLPLGADISGSQYLEPDGNFPNHVPNPEDDIAMESISSAVLKSKADLGIIFDTDVDRSAAVSGSGKPIQRNGVIALAAAIGKSSHKGGTVVTDSITSNELNEFLEKNLGLNHLRFKRGYKNVINKAKEMRSEDAFLAIETSGHAAYSDNHYLDDGAYLACLIIVEATRLKKEGKDILNLISSLKEPCESKEYRFKIIEEKIWQDSVSKSRGITAFSDYADIIIESLRYFAEESEGFSVVSPNYEGVRINYDLPISDSEENVRGWLLLRKSLHDPVMPMNIESDKMGGSIMVLSIIKDFLSQFDAIEI